MKTKRLYGFLLLFLSLHFYSINICTASTNNHLLTVVIMIKNEETAIEKTLLPYIQAGIDSYLVLDTGSTDNTIRLVKNLFKKHNITHGYIVEQPFVDFATSRNYALECAEKQFPNAQFFLMPDAEWYLQNIKELLEFCKNHTNDPEPSYGTLLLHPEANITFFVFRLFKAHKGIKFEGVVHEVINYRSTQKTPDSVFFIWNPSKKGQEQSYQRKFRDLDVLLKDNRENPDNLRTIFYIGQTYAALHKWEESCLWYKKRCAANDFHNEENYAAHYRIAKIYETTGSWDDALQYHLKAYKIRPYRAEPLVRIARHYCDTKQYSLAYKFALMATEMPYPEKDYLCIEQEAYNFTGYDILGCSAFYLGLYKTGEWAVRKALLVHPEMAHLHTNLNLYKTAKKLKKRLLTFTYPHHYILNGYYKYTMPLIIH